MFTLTVNGVFSFQDQNLKHICEWKGYTMPIVVYCHILSAITLIYIWSQRIIDPVRPVANRLHSEQYHTVSFTNSWKKNQDSDALKFYFDLTETYNPVCSQRKGDSLNEKLRTEILE